MTIKQALHIIDYLIDGYTNKAIDITDKKHSFNQDSKIITDVTDMMSKDYLSFVYNLKIVRKSLVVKSAKPRKTIK